MTNGGRVRDLTGIVHEWKPTPIGNVEEEMTNCGRAFIAGYLHQHGYWTYTELPVTCPECRR